ATQIVTASDDEAVISLWDLRHAHSPEKTLVHKQGGGGILDISWCRQDMDLLLSSGKDGKTLCWNPNKGDLLGEIHSSSKWAHQVEWCPRNPDMLATASVDGVISVHSIQGSSSYSNTTTLEKNKKTTIDITALSSSSNLELKTPPKWLRRPVGASFGFSGKLVTFKGSSVKITTCAMDSEMVKRSEQLASAVNEEPKMKELINQRMEEGGQDWRMLHTLFSENAREQLVEYLGFEKEQVMTEATRLLDTSAAKRDVPTGSPDNDNNNNNREDMFGIPSTLQLYNGSDTDKLITRAIVLGDFETAVDLCLQSERYSDAILVGICGGQELLTRAQNAYFASQSQPAYLRLLQGIMQDDLMTIVKQVALEEWASALVVLCTFAQPKDFGLLCETLGDRLTDTNAALCCYLAAGHLAKVSHIWIDHLEKLKASVDEMTYHFQLQEFIEKMTLFRKAIDYKDTDQDGLTALHTKYGEYAEWMASHGKLQVALQYINLTPIKGNNNNNISVIRDRVFHACSKWSTQYKEPRFPFERETLMSNTSFFPPPPPTESLYTRVAANTSEPSHYYIPEYHTQQQQQPIYSPTTTYKNYIPQLTTHHTAAYSIQTSNPTWNDPPPIITDLNKPHVTNVATPFAHHPMPTTPPQQQHQLSSPVPPPPSSSYYSARQQPAQPMTTPPPPPMNAVAPTPMSRRP
ncbi:hypothetical protein K501DRAFT_280203, partial [Backusella circina FSU 941]